MSVSTLCQGCGNRVEAPADHDRPRIRCPHCGVMCELPSQPARKPAAPKASSPPPTVSLEDAEAEAVLLEEVPAPRTKSRRRADDLSEDPPARSPRPPSKPKTVVPAPEPFAYDHSHEDDGKPYFVPSLDDERPCPSCSFKIPREAVLCTRCGLDLRVGKKVVQEYEPVDREWMTGFSVELRVGLFAGLVLVVVPLMGLSALAAEITLFGWLFPALVFVVMLAFVLGTFDRVRLKRNRRGQVHLTKSWWICFLPRPKLEIDVHDYAAIVTGQAEDVKAMEWVTCFLLIGAFIIPGILFYLLFINQTSSEVLLTKEHGKTGFTLYRGGDRDVVVDIVKTVSEVAHLPIG